MTSKKNGFGQDLQQVSSFCYRARNLDEISLELVHDYFGGTISACEAFLDVLVEKGVITYKEMSKNLFVFGKHKKRKERVLCSVDNLDKYPDFSFTEDSFNIPIFNISNIKRFDRLAFLKPHFSLSPSPKIPSQFVILELNELYHYLTYLSNSNRYFVYVDKLEMFGEMLDPERPETLKYVDLVVDIKPKIADISLYTMLCYNRLAHIVKKRSHVLDFGTPILDVPKQELLHVLNRKFPDFGIRSSSDKICKTIESEQIYKYDGEFEVHVVDTELGGSDKEITDEIVNANSSVFEGYKSRLESNIKGLSTTIKVDKNTPIQ